MFEDDELREIQVEEGSTMQPVTKYRPVFEMHNIFYIEESKEISTKEQEKVPYFGPLLVKIDDIDLKSA